MFAVAHSGNSGRISAAGILDTADTAGTGGPTIQGQAPEKEDNW